VVDYVTIGELEQHEPGPGLVEFVRDIALRAYDDKVSKTDEDSMRELERWVLLKAVNDRFMDHLQTVDYIREGIGLRGYGQVDPLVAYKRETYDTFQNTLKNIRDQASKMIFHLRPHQEDTSEAAAPLMFNMDEMEDGYMPPELQESHGSPMRSTGTATLTPVDLEKVDWKRVGRNDPCPCGSGKKFKECHYRNLRAEGVI
jgi:preprotein translocase subunit SecA